MMRNKFILIAVCFIALAFITGFIYHRGKHRHPFRYELDLTTLSDWYDDLSKNGGDGPFVISFVDKGPYDFTNDNDPGEDDLFWLKKEDEYFIVYYSTELNPKTGSFWANNCLEVAHDAVSDLERIMGRYYYPSDVMDNRKLCIYLPENPSEYSHIINELAGRPVDSAGSIGMTLATITQCGPIADGIVLHPSCFAPDVYELNDYRTTLRHEMSHYVYFMALNYGEELNHPLWVSEGIAEFIGRSRPQVSGPDTIRFIAGQCDLNANFPVDGPFPNAAYWAGESFFRFISDSCGFRAPTTFLSTLYDAPVASGLAVLFPEGDSKERWLESLRQNDTLKHPEYIHEGTKRTK